jgi:antitoxin MazE
VVYSVRPVEDPRTDDALGLEPFVLGCLSRQDPFERVGKREGPALVVLRRVRVQANDASFEVDVPPLELQDFGRSYTVITMATKTRIVRIGNSRGIRIPKTLLDEANLPEEVELHAQPGRLVVQAARHPRTGWAAAAKRMRARGDDRLLDESTSTKFDREEWEWR